MVESGDDWMKMVEARNQTSHTHPDAAPHTLHGNAHAQAWEVLSNDALSAVLALDSATRASAASTWQL